LSAIAASHLGLEDIMGHYDDDDDNDRRRRSVGLVLASANLEDLAASRPPASQRLSAAQANTQWQVLEQAAKKALAAEKALDQARGALNSAYVSSADGAVNSVNGLNGAYGEAVRNASGADRELVSAILYSPFNADEIQTHFSGVNQSHVGPKNEIRTVQNALHQRLSDALYTIEGGMRQVASRPPGSPTMSAAAAEAQWLVLQQAAEKVLTAKIACEMAGRVLDVASASGSKEFKTSAEGEYGLADRNASGADRELASAILYSPFSAEEIRTRFGESAMFRRALE
jgi:hypothetical protein